MTLYRPCVGIMLINKDRKVFVGRRHDHSSEAWQMPQGGVEPGEDLERALFREMEEEIGTKNAKIIARSKQPLRYDLPEDLRKRLWGGRYIGQEQHWFLLKFLGKDSEINIDTQHPEFVAYKWAPVDTLVDIIVPFKRDVYMQIVNEFTPIIQAKNK